MMKYEVIEKKELTKVHEFDFYYEDFQKIIREICQTMDETDELLLNVSSGTPAMKSGLLVLQTRTCNFTATIFSIRLVVLIQLPQCYHIIIFMMMLIDTFFRR